MPRKSEKPKTGAAKHYITRTQAVRKLQISLPDFRRLCIFKGIYPREPRNKQKVKKGSTPSTTFYYTKDIQFLQHEPLLNKFREHNALAKKIGRALGRNEADDAFRLERGKSRISLDHLVKERYPTFVDALRDLDDALSMLFLFAGLPSTVHVPPKTIALCQRLCLEFQQYIIVSSSLRKSFLSIKGVYYQATIQGQDIMWLVPYKFVQKMTGDIDFRIMGTFIEFYTTLLGFVNYRLYTTIGLVYPPKFNPESDKRGGELGAYTIEGDIRPMNGSFPSSSIGQLSQSQNQKLKDLLIDPKLSMTAQAEADRLAITTLATDEEPELDVTVLQDGDIDTFQPISEDADVLPQPQHTNSSASNLFTNKVFFLSRETPKASLEFILRSFGCTKVGWHEVLGDGAYTTNESDSRITHQVVDRPPSIPPLHSNDDEEEEDFTATAPVQQFSVVGRCYVQPQWVWDCINQGRLLRTDLYAPGQTLPPHLSPFVKSKPGAYDPTLPLAVQEKEGEAELDYAEAVLESTNGHYIANSDDDKGSIQSSDKSSASASESEIMPGEGMDVDDSGEDDDEVQEDAEITKETLDAERDGLSDAEADDSEDEYAHDRDEYQKGLEAEVLGRAPNNPAKDKVAEMRKKRTNQVKKEEEELNRQRMMMPNRKRKLFDKMQFGNKKRDAEAEKLRQKRRRLERQNAK